MTRFHQLHLGHVTLPDTHPRAAERTCQIYSYVIDHPDGLIVVDTGPDPAIRSSTSSTHPRSSRSSTPSTPSGLDERNVAAVVNTHLHFDHCGQNHLLGHAPVWITQAELDVSTTEFYTVPEWAEIEPDRLRLAADGEAIADGVTILHTPGHTPGHLSVTVATDTGLEIVVGQACYTCAEFDAGTGARPTCTTPAGTSRARLARPPPRARPVRAHFSHDATTYTPS